METKYQEQFIKFGLKVQYYRKLRGMTQEAFADQIGKSGSFVAKIESPTRAFHRIWGLICPNLGLLTKWEFSTAEDGRKARKKTPLASIQTLYHSLEV